LETVASWCASRVLSTSAPPDSVLSAVALTPVAVPVMLDLSRTTSIIDCALARLSEMLKARDVRFRGLRLHHERLLESVHLAERVPA